MGRAGVSNPGRLQPAAHLRQVPVLGHALSDAGQLVGVRAEELMCEMLLQEDAR